MESVLYAIRCGSQGVGVADGDSPGHEGKGPRATKSALMYEGSISWKASEMWIPISSEDVVEVREVSGEQEVKESAQSKDMVTLR